MSSEKDRQHRGKSIAESISAVAPLQPVPGSNEEYELESSFADSLKKKSSGGQEVSLVKLAQQLSFARDEHEFHVEKEKHQFRKRFLWCLFSLTCFWLFIVICFVGWNAMSPSIENREMLLHLQTQLSSTLVTTNAINASVLTTVTPHFCPILFHLSDSVLIAFITSTTVAVLGLFLTAANWLYGKHSQKESHPIDSAPKQPEE